jgi:ubiquinone/menaquinone biosynthesis C-methylase UbiE
LPKGSDWLLPFVGQLRAGGSRLLEVGCGPGLDAATLVDEGFDVTGFDRAVAALARAKASVAGAAFLRADAVCLPFRDGAFDAAVASLSLHYLPWAETRTAFREVRRVLGPGAPFVFRVNATDDVHHGAGEGEELEANFYRNAASYHAETKRFFDDVAVRAAAVGLFEVEHLAHVTIHRYEMPKRVWECLGRAV